MNTMDRELKAKIIQKYGSQFGFAHALGWHESIISRVLRGRMDLTAEQRRVWANALDDEPENLFKNHREG